KKTVSGDGDPDAGFAKKKIAKTSSSAVVYRSHFKPLFKEKYLPKTTSSNAERARKSDQKQDDARPGVDSGTRGISNTGASSSAGRKQLLNEKASTGQNNAGSSKRPQSDPLHEDDTLDARALYGIKVQIENLARYHRKLFLLPRVVAAEGAGGQAGPAASSFDPQEAMPAVSAPTPEEQVWPEFVGTPVRCPQSFRSGVICKVLVRKIPNATGTAAAGSASAAAGATSSSSLLPP
ncbi:unnamed protein product, partial [Amoebophrya sp. A120]